MWEGSEIRIERISQICINALQSQVSCDHCLEVCPSEAIVRNEKGDIVLHKEACTGCGACLCHCPTEVYKSEDWKEQKLIQRVAQSEYDVVELFCGGHDKPYGKADKENPRDFVRVNVCFAALSKAAWFEMAQKKKLIIHREACDECEIRSCEALWTDTVEQTREYLAACQLTPRMEICSVKQNGSILRRRWADTSGEKATSRREFLLKAGNIGMDAVLPSFLKTAKAPTSQQHGESATLWPVWSQRFGVAYSKAEIEHGRGEAAMWPYIQVQDNCISCGVCSYFCPTGALQKIEKDGMYQTIFNAGRCADCRLCEELCCQKAILRSRRAIHQPFRPRIVQEVKLVSCRKCGTVCAENESGLCHWCRSEDRLRPMLDKVKLAMKKPTKKI